MTAEVVRLVGIEEKKDYPGNKQFGVHLHYNSSFD